MTFLGVLTLLPFYLLGAFPTGVIVSKLHGINIYEKGSGNVGATNIARTIGAKAGAITLLGDVLKGLIASVGAYLLFGGTVLTAWCGLAAVCGHCFSIPKFLKGGKGVATGLGVLLGIVPQVASAAVAVFIITFLVTRIVSASSIAAAASAPLFLMFLLPGFIGWEPIALISILIVFKHKDNIDRMVHGKESKFVFRG